MFPTSNYAAPVVPGQVAIEGGMSNNNVPYEPWQLDTLLLQLAPLTTDAPLASWKTCPDAGMGPASCV